MFHVMLPYHDNIKLDITSKLTVVFVTGSDLILTSDDTFSIEHRLNSVCLPQD